MDNDKADRMIALLEEIRALQEQHLNHYQTALRNQQESVELQKQAMRRMKAFVFPLLIAVILAVFIVLGIISSYML